MIVCLFILDWIGRFSIVIFFSLLFCAFGNKKNFWNEMENFFLFHAIYFMIRISFLFLYRCFQLNSHHHHPFWTSHHQTRQVLWWWWWLVMVAAAAATATSIIHTFFFFGCLLFLFYFRSFFFILRFIWKPSDHLDFGFFQKFHILFSLSRSLLG